MNLRTVRIGFLLLAGLIAGGAALPDRWHVTTAGKPEIEGAPEAAEWRHFNERCSIDSLRTMAAAEADFRANDEDGDRVEDFWTFDVQGIYTLTLPKQPEK